MVGTGTVDMKAGIAALWGALAWLSERQQDRSRLRLIVVPDEEVGGAISRGVLRDRSLGAPRVWSLEPGRAVGSGETIVAARRGLLCWRLEITGTAAHSGADYWSGRSALVAAAAWSTTAVDQSRPDDGPIVNASRLVAGGQDLVDEGRWDLVRSFERLNVVPDRAVVEGEIRCIDPESAAELETFLATEAQRVADRFGTRAQFEITQRIDAVAASPRQLAAAERVAALAARRGWQIETERDRRGISFTNLLPHPAPHEVLDGLRLVGGGMHTRDEFVSLGSLRRRIELLADMLVVKRD